MTNKIEDTGQAVFHYAYDLNGRLTNRWTPEKGATIYRYDPVGNLTNVDYPQSPDLTLAYDGLNRLTNLVDGVGATRYSYSAVGQLLSEDGPWSDNAVSYSYANRLRTGLSVQQPNAAAWSQGYAYDVLKRLTGVTSPAGSFGYSYNIGSASSPAALIRKLTLPNGAYITNEFDAVSRLTSTVLYNSQDVHLNVHTYTYDLSGLRTRHAFQAGNYVDYTYDPIGRLKSAFGKESGGAIVIRVGDRHRHFPARWILRVS